MTEQEELEYKREEQEFLKKYDITEYPQPSVTADISIFSVFQENKENYRKLTEKKLKILLIRRGTPPYKWKYALPGGFVRKNETIEQAAFRELKEETHVECDFLKPVKMVSDIGRDPRGWIMTCLFTALVDEKKLLEVKGDDDADSAEWFEISFTKNKEEQNFIEWTLLLKNGETVLSAVLKETKDARFQNEFPDLQIVENHGLAFDHAALISYSILNLRRLITNTNIVFELLPDKFTLTELQNVHEMILDKKLLAPAFRRKIADTVEETEEFEDRAGHRPSKLYRQKK